MKVYELLISLSNKINGYKKIIDKKVMKRGYNLELGSSEEIKLLDSVEEGNDDHQLLWYENKKLAHALYIYRIEGEGIVFSARTLDVLSLDEKGNPDDYDAKDGEWEFAAETIEEAVEEFIEFIKKQ